MEKYFKRGNGKTCTYTEMIQAVADYISLDPKANYEIAIGTDSQNHDRTKIVEVIAVSNVGHGGIYFYHTEYVTRITEIKRKIQEETTRSIKNAEGFLDALDLELISRDIDLNEVNPRFCIHCDIGSEGKTSVLISEIINWVHGCGYENVIIKSTTNGESMLDFPYAASSIANKITK